MTYGDPPGSIPWHPFIGGGCVGGACHYTYRIGDVSTSIPSVLPVYVPIPEWSDCVTIVTVDKDRNVMIKVDQPKSESWKPCPRCINGVCISVCERDWK